MFKLRLRIKLQTQVSSSVCPSDFRGLLFTDLFYDAVEKCLLLPTTAQKTDIQAGALDSAQVLSHI